MRRGLAWALAAWGAWAAVAAGTECREWDAMGTRVRFLARGATPEAFAAMADAARDALESVEAETSVFRKDSATARVSAAAGNGEWVGTGPDFDAALDLSLAVAGATGGAFNPLVAPLMEAHGFARHPEGAAPPKAPSSGTLDWRRIERRPGACRLPAAGMALDFGGVAKGVGADRAAAAARRAATNDFLVDAGGTLVGRGAWNVGIRDPLAGPDDPPLRAFTLPDGRAAATSGNYERSAIAADGTRTGHILDPRTGRPAGGPVLQVTVLAPTAAEADAWSTACFVLGPDASRSALAGTPGIVPLWVLAGSAGDGGAEGGK